MADPISVFPIFVGNQSFPPTPLTLNQVVGPVVVDVAAPVDVDVASPVDVEVTDAGGVSI